jgi:hypothetical protein
MDEEGGCLGASRLNRNQQSLLAAVVQMEVVVGGGGPTHYLSIQTGAQSWGGREGRKSWSSPVLEMHYSYIPLTGLVIVLNHYRVWSPNF